MSLYPYNTTRANRVHRLASDIAHDQTRLVEAVEEAREEDAKSIKILEEVAIKAGYKGLDEYIVESEKLMSDDERAVIEKMKKDMEGLDESMVIAHRVFRGLAAAGLLLHGIRLFASGFAESHSIIMGLTAVGLGIWNSIKGFTETAVKLFTFGKVALSFTRSAAGVSESAVRGLKMLRLGGNVLIGVGVIVDAGLLIFEAINGANQSAELQENIKLLVCHRFLGRQIQQSARAILSFKSDAKSIASSKKKFDEWVKKNRMTLQEVAEELAPDYAKLSSDLKEKMDKITPQTIWDDLDTQDKVGTWIEEDPDLPYIEDWVKKHPDGK